MILFFLAVILAGGALLHLPASSTGKGNISWIDALFTATSACCVTGLAVLDTGRDFTRTGETVILCLIQLGGLGIMSFTGLAFYLWRQKVSMTDRIAVGQSLLHDPAFHLGRFLIRIVFWTGAIELSGAVMLHLLDRQGFPLFSSVFHSVSAFCNAGFGLRSDSLVAWQGDWPVNTVFMLLIILGGLGFSVLVELEQYGRKRRHGIKVRLSCHSRLVLSTSLALVIGGAAAINLAEFFGYARQLSLTDGFLVSLFQSVTTRTAGFNTVPIDQLTNVTLSLMLILMFIGGAPGSCAGGIKVTTLRCLLAHLTSQIFGREQAASGDFAYATETVKKAMLLTVVAGIILTVATLLLNITEGGDIPHPETRGLFLEILFESVSAFGTVGLSTGLTPKLTVAGKIIIMALMFIGRLGPLLFIATLQDLHRGERFLRVERTFLIG